MGHAHDSFYKNFGQSGQSTVSAVICQSEIFNVSPWRSALLRPHHYRTGCVDPHLRCTRAPQGEGRSAAESPWHRSTTWNAEPGGRGTEVPVGSVILLGDPRI